MKKLSFDFFLQDITKVAISLLGKEINFYQIKGIITEVETYTQDDECSHSYSHAKNICGPKKTLRNAPMFEQGGTLYVYKIWYNNYCANISTNIAGIGEAILIRGVVDLENKIHYNGPSKLCKYLGINTSHNFMDIIHDDFYIQETNYQFNSQDKYDNTPRINVSKNKKNTNDLKRYIIKKKYLNEMLTSH